MGVYYSGISKREYSVDGTRVLFSNFYGKAPSWSASRRAEGHWNRFETRAYNTASQIQMNSNHPEYVMYGSKMEEGTSVAKWNGQAILSDGFWDNNTIGTLHKSSNGRWIIALNKRGREDRMITIAA